MMSLPLHHRLSDDDVDDIIDAVGSVAEKFRRRCRLLRRLR